MTKPISLIEFAKTICGVKLSPIQEKMLLEIQSNTTLQKRVISYHGRKAGRNTMFNLYQDYLKHIHDTGPSTGSLKKGSQHITNRPAWYGKNIHHQQVH